ncbi:MAG: hypothetical protein IPN69_16360 [Acidobacteria bacterium]|nr:hypothetical protein [Acidobacteriota bacterium]
MRFREQKLLFEGGRKCEIFQILKPSRTRVVRFQSIPVDSSRFQSIPVDSSRFQSIPVDSSRFQSIPVDSSRFQSIPVDSSRFQPRIP